MKLLRNASVSKSPRAAFFVAAGASIKADVESSPEGVAETSMNDHVTGSEVHILQIDSQAHRREKAQLTVVQLDKIQNPTCAVLQKHEDSLLVL